MHWEPFDPRIQVHKNLNQVFFSALALTQWEWELSVCVYTRCCPAFHTVHAETDSSPSMNLSKEVYLKGQTYLELSK